jgi:hypothetical protein
MNATDPVADVPKKPTAWTLFQKRVAGLTGLPQSDVMQFGSYLKGQKDMAAWLDTEIAAAIPDWRVAKEAEPKKEKPVKEKAVKEEKPVKEKAVKEEKPEKAAKPVKEKAAKEEKPEKTKAAKAAEEDPTSAEPEKATEKTAPSANTLEFHLLEAKKKLATATAIADKADSDAKKASDRAEEAMKLALELKGKADVVIAAAAEARATVAACQKEVSERTEEFEKASAAAVAAPTPAPSETVSEEPLHVKRKAIPKHIKTLVWNKYIGADIASADCVSCRSMKISNRSFHCGHVIAESKGGDMTINNLRPICEACNGSMGTKSMNEFTKEFFGWVV